MFNKPSMFPKSSEPAVGRSSRPVGSTSPALTTSTTSSGASTSPSTVSPAPDSVSKPVDQDVNRADGGASAAEATGSGSRLIVGPDVKLKGAEILDCDTLVVEGRVEATMDSRVIRIAEAGAFSGKVGIDIAEIHGVFDGELTAREQLFIHSTGRVSGKIRYGRILIEEGGEVSGDVQPLAAAAKSEQRPQDKPSGSTSTSSPEVKSLTAVAG